jgi:hypothetical protein
MVSRHNPSVPGRWIEGGLTRDEVAARVETGWPWRLTFCEGSFNSPIDGVGDLPGDVLAHVPTAAAKRSFSTASLTRPTSLHASK